MNDLEKLLAEAYEACAPKPTTNGMGHAVRPTPITTKPKTNFRNPTTVRELITSVLSHGFTRTQVASFCGTNRLTVCAWEVGEMIPNYKHADKLQEMWMGLFGEVRAG